MSEPTKRRSSGGLGLLFKHSDDNKIDGKPLRRTSSATQSIDGSGLPPVRVLVVYGSETGNVRRAIGKCVSYWQANCDGSFKLEWTDVKAGNEVQGSLDEIRARYDVVIVATSSFGEGDPPANFTDFLVRLVRAGHVSGPEAPNLNPPLRGMQHAVLGFGQSIYPTFQNCPRYVDKLLGHLGSRRFARRVEVDEGPTEDMPAGGEVEGFTTMGSGGAEAPEVAGRSQSVQRFTEDVLWALQSANETANKAPVCGWHTPGDGVVIEATEEELRTAQTAVAESMATWVPAATLMVAAALAAAALYARAA